MPKLKLDRSKIYHSYNVEAAVKYGVLGATLLSHIAYWMEVYEGKKDHTHDGKTWIYFEWPDLVNKFPEYTFWQLKRGFLHLVKKKAIARSNYNKKGYDNTNWYTILDPLFYKVPRANLHGPPCKSARAIPDKEPNKEKKNKKRKNFETNNEELRRNHELEKTGKKKPESF